MIHAGVIEINGRGENGNEEVFGDDRCRQLKSTVER